MNVCLMLLLYQGKFSALYSEELQLVLLVRKNSLLIFLDSVGII